MWIPNNGFVGLVNANVFWSRVHKTDSCWLWTGAKSNQGYGSVGIDGTTYKAHRIAYWLANGLPPDNKPYVLHKCDNPACVNPEHLFAGTQSDNINDMHAKGRAATNLTPGESNGNSSLTEEDVRQIKTLFNTGCYSKYRLAQLFDISQAEIFRIIKGIRWAHVTV